MLDPTPHIRTLADAELYRVELEARRAARRIAYAGVALFFLALAFVMLVVAAYLALARLYDDLAAALIMGGGLVLLAFVLLVLARKQPSRADRLELELANQRIATARAEVRRDFDILERQLDRMTMGLLGILKGSTSGLPLVTLILGALSALSPALRRILAPLLKTEGDGDA